MASRDIVQRALCKKLGSNYQICNIDMEQVIYRDFGNGFNVEISGTYTTSEKKPAIIYLWFGSHFVIRVARDVPRDKIGEKVEELLTYSNDLIKLGYNDRDSLWKLLNQ